MTQKEIDILRIEESFRDTIENDIAKTNTENREIKVKNVKYVGKIEWQDKINKKMLSENLFLVDVEVKQIDDNGNIREYEQEFCYLGEQRIGGTIGNNPIAFNSLFENSEPEKYKAVNDLLEKVSLEEIENNSLNNLKKKELKEVLSAHLGREVTDEEVEKLLEDFDKDEIEQLKEEQQTKKNEDNNKLTKKQTEKIKVNGIQKVDLNKLVDGKETLGKRLDLNGYQTMYVVYSDKVNDITAGTKINNTTYSLVGVTNDGEAKVLNDEFQMDCSVGNSATKKQTKIRANSTATRDSKDLSVYTRKSNGMSIGCENDMGNVNLFLYQKTKEENENVGVQIETSKTPVIPIETKEVINRNKGTYQSDKVQDEIEKHTNDGCNPENVKDFDGDENTSSHEHIESNEVNGNDYIPNTNMTWDDFANKCGIRGQGYLEKTVEIVNELPEITDDSLEEYVEEQENDYRAPDLERKRD